MKSNIATTDSDHALYEQRAEHVRDVIQKKTAAWMQQACQSRNLILRFASKSINDDVGNGFFF